MHKCFSMRVKSLINSKIKEEFLKPFGIVNEFRSLIVVDALLKIKGRDKNEELHLLFEGTETLIII